MSESSSFYFSKYENRKPYEPIQISKFISLVYKLFLFLTLVSGFIYIFNRWIYSINGNSPGFSFVLLAAETLCYVGTLLSLLSLWDYKDSVAGLPVHMLSEIVEVEKRKDRPITIDVFIASYNEDADLVRLTINDAKKMKYPFPDVSVEIYLLDDGRRDGRNPNSVNLKAIALQEHVNYLTRDSNEGYKAGNLANGLMHTNGDLFLILDADTRVFPTFLEDTTGYFRNKNLAWVQTPQWFYDLTPSESLNNYMDRIFKLKNNTVKSIMRYLFSGVKVNNDIFGNDTQYFYDVILRKRNRFEAVFCCGAGSIHRREAVMDFALNKYELSIKKLLSKDSCIGTRANQNNKEIFKYLLETSFKPFAFHASEDFYTSILMHANYKSWKSIFHPKVECKMLSTQDVNSRSQQYQRYAEGTLDIALNKRVLFKKGLSFGQRICYFSTVWSYVSPLWIIIFLVSPIYYFFTLRSPISSFDSKLFSLFAIFQICNTVSITFSSWGLSQLRSSQYYIIGFWYMTKAIFKTIFKKSVAFNVTPKLSFNDRSIGNILPHTFLIVVGLIGFIFNLILFSKNEHPDSFAFLINSIWCLFNFIPLFVFINAFIYSKFNLSDEKI